MAKNSCLLEQPVAAKIRLIIGEVSSSSSMVEREALEAVEIAVALVDNRESNGEACDNECFVGTFFLMTYGLSAVLRRRRGGAVPLREEGSFSLLL